MATIDNVINEVRKFILSNYKDIIAIILHGSAARGTMGNFSDIDVTVIIQGSPPTKKRSMFFDGYLTNIGFVNLKRFIEVFGTKDVYEVIWKRLSIAESKAIYDPYNTWPKLQKACKVRIDSQLEEEMLRITYTAALIALGKMNNAYISKNREYVIDSGIMFAHQVSHIILTINKLFLRSWKDIYSLLKHAKIKPPHFWNKYSVVAGYNRNAKYEDIVKCAFLLLSDIKSIILNRYTNIKNEDFKKILNEPLDRYDLLKADMDDCTF